MIEGLAVVTGVSSLTQLTVLSSCVMSAFQTHSSTDPTRLLEHCHTEPALTGVTITLTC